MNVPCNSKEFCPWKEITVLICLMKYAFMEAHFLSHAFPGLGD